MACRAPAKRISLSVQTKEQLLRPGRTQPPSGLEHPDAFNNGMLGHICSGRRSAAASPSWAVRAFGRGSAGLGRQRRWRAEPGLARRPAPSPGWLLLPEPHKDNRSGSVSANPLALYMRICRGSQSGGGFHGEDRSSSPSAKPSLPEY